jgi:hypothetical protein
LLSVDHSRALLFLSLVPLACWLSACAAALGPGYSIDKQEIHVQFVPAPEPAIRIDAVYHLRNTGNQPLSSLELRLPGRRRFHFSDPRAEWDGTAVAVQVAPSNPRNSLIALPQPWMVSATHLLRLSVQYQGGGGSDANLTFAADAFFLPAQGWSPELVPARGIFATGGVPPKTWSLVLQVPEGFLVHFSGRQSKASRSNGQQIIRAILQPQDQYPFVIAGRFSSAQLTAGPELVNLWTRTPQDAASLRQPADALVRAIQAYDAMFGTREKESHQLWIVECPVVTGCFSTSVSIYSKLLNESNEKISAEMASADTVMVDLSGGTPEIATAAAPSLASSWLGYGRNPGFYDQTPPLAALPAFAASRGREAVLGPQVRAETIRRVLRAIPLRGDPRKPEDDAVVRAKSLLFFYSLQDRYGPDTFNKALQHMLYARRGGGFDIDDLIAAFEQETHENVAQFVRGWMKHPGVPNDFRARYENASASTTATSQETTQ